MDKTKADVIIHGYIEKLYGFALSKMRDMQRAEDLASHITLEVYSVLLSREGIKNLEGYIYRIAENVYSRYIAGYIKKSCLPLDGMDLPVLHDFTEDIEDTEEGTRLRREVAFLSAAQRRIVWLHYYENKKLSEIARFMDIPAGTVKWHLYEAKQSLREGMNKVRENGTLSINPIKLNSLGHCGMAGNMGDTSDFLKRQLTQNIAYATYWQPRTINEIATELGVAPVFVEEEVAVLEEYGFMDKSGRDKYITNIYITEYTQQISDKEDILFNKAAVAVCEKYVPTLNGYLRDMDKSDIYIPDSDFNLLLWSAITAACSYRLGRSVEENTDKYSIKRKDGGDYIALAGVQKNIKVNYNPDLYNACGDMTRGSMIGYPVSVWQLNTYYDKRTGGWRDNQTSDYETLYEFISGILRKEDSQLEKFRRLYDKGYLRKESDTVNLIIVRDDTSHFIPNIPFIEKLPGLTEELLTVSQQLDEEMYAIRKDLYPEHMRGLCKVWNNNTITSNGVRMRVLEKLLQKGTLTLPKKEQQAGLLTLMFCDRLPENRES